MFKYVISAVLCFGPSISCMSHEIPREVEMFGSKISPGLLYIGCANMHMLLHDYEMALEDFRRASFCAEQCDEAMSKAIELAVLFGQVICYDNVNLRHKCEQSLSSLILSLAGRSFDEVFHIEEIESVTQDERDVVDSFELAIEEDDDMTSIAFFKQLIQLAPSQDIREALTSIIENRMTN